MNFIVRSHLLALLILYGIVTTGQIIPGDRRIEWSPGIENGIPEITAAIRNVLDYGADSTGVNDSRSAFITALNSVPYQGGVVFVPAGSYKISSTITIGKNNVVVRGQGKKTKILMDFSGDCFRVETYRRGDWQNVSAELIKDSVTVTVPDGTKFSAGQFAEIQQENDPQVMYTRSKWNQSWAQNSVGQLFEVKGVEGNRVTFKTPLHISFSERLNPQIRPQDFVRNVGFENFYIQKLEAGGHTFSFKNAAYCWIKNVESYHTRKSHVNLTSSLGCEIRDSYFHHSFSYGGGGSAYGVECAFHATDNLVENNIFAYLRHSMMVHLGANGNVFGYNYSLNNVQGEGETNLNVGWIPPDISVHGHYPYMNLFEGNEVEEVGIGDYWGPAGIGNTYFRNKVNGEGILYHDNSDYQNVIGNVTKFLKTSGGNSRYKLEHGNVINGKTFWNSSIEERELPFSYYLNSTPSFFNNQENWPPYGPDQSNEAKLPARVRYENQPVTSARDYYLREDETEPGIKLFPNPVYNNLKVISDREIRSISIYDITGNKREEYLKVNDNRKKINMEALKNGIYLIEIMVSDEQKIFKKIVKK